MRVRIAVVVAAAIAVAAGCSGRGAAPVVDLRGSRIENTHAYIPPQCYVETREQNGPAHNPCFVCHQTPRPPTAIDDSDVQRAWTFATPAVVNPWSNLFRDRSAAVAAISDAEIDVWVGEDNYRDASGIRLARRLTPPPAEWDEGNDGRWDGYVPDCWFAFDERGFDRRPSGGYTGWRVLAYAPLPGMFLPANGSIGDVMIRLPPELREDSRGRFDRSIYEVNLAIVEAWVRQRDVPIELTDEARFGDLDGDGRLATARVVRFREEPRLRYAGRGATEQQRGRQMLVPGLYPIGTELLHSTRYLQVRPDGRVGMAPRMKELRYARKTQWRSPAQLRAQAWREARERGDLPERLRILEGDLERGVGNGQGWVYRGFIEDARGELRPQTFEETVFCVGCHSGIGATTDSSFALPRRLGPRSFRGGWYHWSTRGLEGIPEPVREDGEPEYTRYLRENGAGDDLRTNDEVRARFFDASGVLRPDELFRLRRDIATLLLPSPTRARRLAKAYRVIVREQSFTRGRDPTIRPVTTVRRRVAVDEATGIRTAVAGPGALRVVGW